MENRRLKWALKMSGFSHFLLLLQKEISRYLLIKMKLENLRNGKLVSKTVLLKPSVSIVFKLNICGSVHHA